MVTKNVAAHALAAGPIVALAGSGIHGMVLPIGCGTEIIGGAGYPAGAPSLVRTDPTTIFLFFYERKIILMTFDTVIVVRPNIVIITAIVRRLKHRKEGQHFSDSVKEKILEKQHHRCADCNRVLNVVDWHHKNGDRSDNRESNCVALCPNCHSHFTA